MSNTISKYISDERLDLITTILEKIHDFKGDSSIFQNQLAGSLTIAESSFIAILYHAKVDSEEGFDRVVKYTIEPYFDILNLLGVPLTLPISNMNDKQRLAIDEGQKYVQAIGELRKIWFEANKD